MKGPTKKLLPVVLLCFCASLVQAQDKPEIPNVDRIRLAEAFRLADSLGNRIWAEWNQAPFAVLLVTPEIEFLIRHPKPSNDFQLLGYDPLLRSKVYFRKRTQPVTFLATFPAVGGVPTIVIGQAENTTAKTSTPWVVTVLHEHFHQLQYSQPRYHSDVNALELSRGDQTGMWMLNYPFPYDWMEMEEHFSLLTLMLADVVEARTQRDFAAKLSVYLKQRHELEQTLSPDDYRYFSFQLWQEGIARYTEYRIAQLAAGGYRPSRAFRGLHDYQSFRDVATQIKRGIMSDLRTSQLAEYKRVIFYALGAAEGLALDRNNASWRSRYFKEPFYLNKYFALPTSSGKSYHAN
jgi:hypothetical protein